MEASDRDGRDAVKIGRVTLLHSHNRTARVPPPSLIVMEEILKVFEDDLITAVQAVVELIAGLLR